jgi:hypothetical protein
MFFANEQGVPQAISFSTSDVVSDATSGAADDLGGE